MSRNICLLHRWASYTQLIQLLTWFSLVQSTLPDRINLIIKTTQSQVQLPVLSLKVANDCVAITATSDYTAGYQQYWSKKLFKNWTWRQTVFPCMLSLVSCNNTHITAHNTCTTQTRRNNIYTMLHTLVASFIVEDITHAHMLAINNSNSTFSHAKTHVDWSYQVISLGPQATSIN